MWRVMRQYTKIASKEGKNKWKGKDKKMKYHCTLVQGSKVTTVTIAISMVTLKNILHHKEEKEMKKLFHIKIQVKNTKVDALFDSSS
jgi:hypothetical protein